MRFLQFKRSAARNAWIREGNLDLFIRKVDPRFKNIWGDYQLANMIANPPGSGSLTKFLEKYEYYYQFYIENILDKRLVEYFKKRGYVATLFTHDDMCISMLGPKPPSSLSKMPRKRYERRKQPRRDK
jgi:hypothetical protein